MLGYTVFLKCTVLLELRCFFSGFLLGSLGTWTLFCSIFDDAFPLLMNQLVVICWELNGISNGGQCLWREGDAFTVFSQFFMLSPLFQNRLVVICLELKGISNGSQWFWREGNVLRHRWNSANLFWKSRTSGTFLLQLLCRRILAGNC